MVNDPQRRTEQAGGGAAALTVPPTVAHLLERLVDQVQQLVLVNRELGASIGRLVTRLDTMYGDDETEQP